jgi:hypothetical protein
MRGIYDVYRSDGFMWQNINTSIKKSGTGVQAILTFSLSNMNGCNVAITH